MDFRIISRPWGLEINKQHFHNETFEVKQSELILGCISHSGRITNIIQIIMVWLISNSRESVSEWWEWAGLWRNRFFQSLVTLGATRWSLTSRKCHKGVVDDCHGDASSFLIKCWRNFITCPASRRGMCWHGVVLQMFCWLRIWKGGAEKRLRCGFTKSV